MPFLLFKIQHQIRSRYDRFAVSHSNERRIFNSNDQIEPLRLFSPDVFAPGFGELFSDKFPDEAKILVQEADQAVDSIFDLLGSGPVDLSAYSRRKDLTWIGEGGAASVSGLLPWHFDFKTRFGWNPKTYFADIPVGRTPGVDIKVPWELSRFQHAITLGQAYRITGNEKYALTFRRHVEDWIDQNPTKFGVNWACPMDIALRAANWVAAWELFQNSPSLSPEFSSKLLSSLAAHGFHVRHYLEWGAGVSSNHYLSDLAGLLYMGFGLKRKEWIQFAKEELERELGAQVFEDGFDYETSTGYHRLVLELFFYSCLVLDRNKTEISGFAPASKSRIKSMFLTLLSLGNDLGSMPLIGDNDSGHMHSFLRREDGDIRSLISLGALFFKERRMKIENWSVPSELVWLFGLSGVETFRSLPGIYSNEIPSRSCGDSGLAVMRNGPDVLVFSAQPNGIRGVGGHTHNDKLSFTLSVGPDEFLIDPGTYSYTSDPVQRNRFRSTSLHNTVMIDGEEQNRIPPNNLFMLYEDSHVNVEQDIPGKRIVASHNGYDRLSTPVLHRRTIHKEQDGVWLVKDDFEGNGIHDLEWSFVCGPKMRGVSLVKDGVDIIGAAGRLKIQMEQTELPIFIEDGNSAPHYGVILSAKIIRIRLKKSLPFSYELKLKWTPQPA